MKICSIIVILFLIMACSNNKTNVNSNLHLETLDTIEKNNIKIECEPIIQKSKYDDFLEKEGLVKVFSLDSTIRVDLKYATTDNFTKQVLYEELKDAYLHPIAAKKIVEAQRLLKDYDPSLSLLIYDAVRPLSIQKKMYDVVKKTPYQAYVANPAKTGLHNYGIAVDLTICHTNGTPLDMGTPFDFFGKAAGINKEEELKAQGLLTDKQIDNRKLLRRIMTKSGFLTIRGEWWHFNAIPLSEAKARTKLIE